LFIFLIFYDRAGDFNSGGSLKPHSWTFKSPGKGFKVSVGAFEFSVGAFRVLAGAFRLPSRRFSLSLQELEFKNRPPASLLINSLLSLTYASRFAGGKKV